MKLQGQLWVNCDDFVVLVDNEFVAKAALLVS